MPRRTAPRKTVEAIAAEFVRIALQPYNINDMIEETGDVWDALVARCRQEWKGALTEDQIYALEENLTSSSEIPETLRNVASRWSDAHGPAARH